MQIKVSVDKHPDLLMVKTGIYDFSGNMGQKLMEATVQLQDEMVRKALIELGWKPPTDNPPDPIKIIHLFHKAWGEAHDSPEYDKTTWNDLRKEMEKALGYSL